MLKANLMQFPTTTCQPCAYNRDECAVFLKTTEKYGSLSNMCGGFPVLIATKDRKNPLRIHTVEHLYQALRFPSSPEAQEAVLKPVSPMAAKMASRPYRKTVNRPDWEDVKIDIMRWCIRVKLAHNWEKFGLALKETGNLTIVEESAKDAMWGAKVDKKNSNVLVGQNVLGNLLMELRDIYNSDRRKELLIVKQLAIPDMMLNGEPIGEVEAFNLKKKLAE